MWKNSLKFIIIKEQIKSIAWKLWHIFYEGWNMIARHFYTLHISKRKSVWENILFKKKCRQRRRRRLVVQHHSTINVNAHKNNVRSLEILFEWFFPIIFESLSFNLEQCTGHCFRFFVCMCVKKQTVFLAKANIFSAIFFFSSLSHYGNQFFIAIFLSVLPEFILKIQNVKIKEHVKIRKNTNRRDNVKTVFGSSPIVILCCVRFVWQKRVYGIVSNVFAVGLVEFTAIKEIESASVNSRI